MKSLDLLQTDGISEKIFSSPDSGALQNYQTLYAKFANYYQKTHLQMHDGAIVGGFINQNTYRHLTNGLNKIISSIFVDAGLEVQSLEPSAGSMDASNPQKIVDNRNHYLEISFQHFPVIFAGKTLGQTMDEEDFVFVGEHGHGSHMVGPTPTTVDDVVSSIIHMYTPIGSPYDINYIRADLKQKYEEGKFKIIPGSQMFGGFFKEDVDKEITYGFNFFTQVFLFDDHLETEGVKILNRGPDKRLDKWLSRDYKEKDYFGPFTDLLIKNKQFNAKLENSNGEDEGIEIYDKSVIVPIEQAISAVEFMKNTHNRLNAEEIYELVGLRESLKLEQLNGIARQVIQDEYNNRLTKILTT